MDGWRRYVEGILLLLLLQLLLSLLLLRVETILPKRLHWRLCQTRCASEVRLSVCLGGNNDSLTQRPEAGTLHTLVGLLP